MKNYTRSTSHRTPGGDFAGEIVIHLPDPTLLRIIARSLLLAAAIISFPWLRVILLQSTAAAAAAAESKWVDDPFSLPMLVGDLKRQGFLARGASALFLGDARSRSVFLKKKRIDPVTEHAKPAVKDRSVDLVLVTDGLAESDPSFGFVDRVVKVGGVVVVRLGSDDAGYFRLPSNYRLAYIRRFGATFVGIKKMFHANAGGSEDGTTRRRLFSVVRSESGAPEGPEGALSEPPEWEEVQLNKPKYLPGPVGDNLLAACQKRVFVGVRKMFHANAGESEDGTTKRRLLSVDRSKSEALEGLEGSLSEPPEWEEVHLNKPKYLPGPVGDNLSVACQKRVFVGIKKIFHANAGESEDGTTKRRLLSVARSKNEAMEGLEDSFLKLSPEWEEVQLNKPKRLPALIWDNLSFACQKRVFVGIKKIFHTNAGESEDGTTKRRLLSVARSKSEALEGLEDALLEPPPEWEEVQLNKPKRLPGLIGDNLLVACQKRVFVGVNKMFHANAGESEGGTTERRLLSTPRPKSEVLEGLEDAFLEPPEWDEIKAYRPKYLPDLMGDNSLVAYPKRVFVDVVGEKGRAGCSEWFGREYPKKGAEFEIVKVDLVEGEGGGGGIAEWLQKNVREEEFVVMKAEAEVVEEMVREEMISLVDELFLECNYQKRAYWECLAIYGRVRAKGIAVHQWWWE